MTRVSVGLEGVLGHGLSLSSSEGFSSCFTHFIALKEFNMLTYVGPALGWGKRWATFPEIKKIVEIYRKTRIACQQRRNAEPK